MIRILLVCYDSIPKSPEKTGVKHAKTRKTETSQIFHKIISTHLLTVLTTSAIT